MRKTLSTMTTTAIVTVVIALLCMPFGNLSDSAYANQFEPTAIISNNSYNALFGVQAKTGVAKLRIGKTYKQYDLTGDAKPDKIAIKGTEASSLKGCYSKLGLYVNGKRVWDARKTYNIESMAMYPEFKIYTLKNGISYISCSMSIDAISAGVIGLIGPQSGSIVCRNLLEAFGGEYVFECFHESIPGGVVLTKPKIRNNAITWKASGGIMRNATLAYQYNNGQMKPSKADSKVTPYSTSIYGGTTSVFKTATGSTVKFKLKSGTRIKVSKIQIMKNRKTRMYITTPEGKTGWIWAQ